MTLKQGRHLVPGLHPGGATHWRGAVSERLAGVAAGALRGDHGAVRSRSLGRVVQVEPRMTLF
jgi:hypothetical protein